MRIEKVIGCIEKGLVIFQLLVLLGVAISLIHSFDTFWQLQSGKYLWQTKTFIHHDTFSLASDVSRIEHCWLHDLLLFASYSLGGYKALSIYKGLLITGTIVFAVWGAKLRGGSWLAIALVYPFAVFATSGGWLARPQLWSFLLFSVFILILEAYRRKPGPYIWALVPLMIFWSNLHAGYVLGYAVMMAYLVGGGCEKLLKRKTIFRNPVESVGEEEGEKIPFFRTSYFKLWVLAGFLVLAGEITPYPSILLSALHGATQSSSTSSSITQVYNMDWRASSFMTNPYFYYTLFAGGGFLLVGWKRLSFTDVFMFSGIAIMGLGLVRHTTFHYIALLVYLPRYVDVLLNLLADLKRPLLRYGSRILFIGLALYALYHYSYRPYAIYGFMNTGLREWHYPIEAAEFVKENKLKPNLYNTYDWGGYLMWTLYPDYKVFWDGRSTSPEMFKNGFAIMGALPLWENLLKNFDVNTIVTKACMVDNGSRYTFLDPLHEHPEWSLVFADESAMVFVRNTSVDREWLKKHKLPSSRIDDTIFSEANLLFQTEPRRVNALWEMALVSLKRKDFNKALQYMKFYIMRAPSPDPRVIKTYNEVKAMLSARGVGRN